MLRIQSPEGTRRVDIDNLAVTRELFEKVLNAFETIEYPFTLYGRRDKSQEIASSDSKTLASYGLKHGDMIFLSPIAGAVQRVEQPTGNGKAKNEISNTSLSVSTPTPSMAGSKIPVRSTVDEDQVDLLLQKMDGTVKRKRDPKNCLHGDNSSCIHCLPLEPYDASYLKDLNVKHMSFNAYLRKLSSGLDGGKYANLDNISCRIKPGCTGHPPWPKGVCSKCQPKAITLNSQPYRHVDNIVFENPNLVEQFLHYWRVTGRQRIGFLYGKFDVHLDVPLGIKGTVAAIYEPPQESTRDSVRLLPDSRQSLVDRLAAKLGLSCIGWIFTDLVAEDISKGTVRNFRNAETHFLSAQECVMAGHFQSLHPNPCRFSSDGYFGSKFVTVCVTGDAQNQVHMEGYQVSNQCQALVRDECLVPTKDAPELAYARQSTAEKYIPDVYYKYQIIFVLKIVNAIQADFLCTCPIELQPIDGHLQDVSALASYLKQFSRHRFIDAASDFHFLVYIATMDMLPLMESMDPLLEAVRSKDAALANQWASGDQWSTVLQLLAHAYQMSTTGQPMEEGTPGDATGIPWTCAHCTFINMPNLSSCEICNLPHQI
uniref:Nuclear protein localization protein 4 homolog n=1 Tax=Daphnia similis TaxID=35528 RepID=A0A4Y7N3E5_9CRUS|nr:EOG090X05T8 [Daphnia similis]